MSTDRSGTVPGARSPEGSPGTSLDRILDVAEARGLKMRRGPTRNEGWICCPVHDERTPSLHATWTEGRRQGGFVLLHCFGCNALGQDIVEALGLTLADLYDQPLPEQDRVWERGRSTARRKAGQRRGHRGRLPTLVPLPREPEPEHQWDEVTRYTYTDRQGTVAQYVIREVCTAEGEPHKRFTQSYLGVRGQLVRRRPEGFFPVLYRAPEVAAAIAAGTPVWLMEGEKDADTAAGLGLVATTNAMGATSFPDDLVPEFEGAHVVLVLDRDQAGWARGIDLVNRIGPVAGSIRVLLPEPTHEKADFTDHVQAGLGVDALVPIEEPELRIWHDLRHVRVEATRVRQALEQAGAQSELEASLGADGPGRDEHRRFARRWAVEGQARFEQLRARVAQTRAGVLQYGTAEGALHAAEDVLEDARRRLRACHDRVGEPVPPLLRDPTEAAPGPSTSPGQESIPGEPAPSLRLTVGTPRFRIWNGAIVQWKDGAPEPGEEGYEEKDSNFKQILSLAVKVIAREFEDSDDDGLSAEETPLMGRASAARARVREHRKLAAVRIRYRDPASEEEMEWRIPVEEWRDHSWLEGLPGAVDYDYRRAGKDTVLRAVMAISTDMTDRTIRQCTGWYRQADGGWGFVHARGVITADGHRDEEVALDTGLESYDLPDPVTDPQVLRQHFLDHSAVLLGRLPDRIAAPVLGHVYRSAIGDHHCTVALVGQKATYKTSIAAKVMNHWGEAWGRRRYGSSMASDQGDTANTLRKRLHDAKDTLYFMDDFAPTDNWAKAQRAMEETARMVWNQQSRNRLDRTAKHTRPGHRPRAAGLMTSEVMPRPGSAADRLLPLPLTASDVDRDDLFPLEEEASRHARAALNASFLSWLAQDYLNRRKHYAGISSAHSGLLSSEGFTDREAEVVGELWAGWVAVLDFLVDVGAVTPTERDAMLHRVDAGLRVALAATEDPDQPRTVGGRVVELLRHAFTQGLAHVDDYRTGDCPVWPHGGRLGWRRTVLDDGSGSAYGPKYRFDRLGVRAGYVITDPGYRDRGRILMLESTALESILKAANSSQTDQLLIDRRTAQVALADLGVLISQRTSAGTVRYTLPCRVPAEQNVDRRFVVLWLDKIFPTDDGDNPEPDQHPETDGPAPGGGDAPTLLAQPITVTLEEGDPPNLAPASSTATAVSDESPAVDAVQHTVVASNASESPPSKGAEVPVPYVFTPHAYTSRDGVVGWSQQTAADAAPAPCVVCGRPAVMTINELRVHIPCWESSTAATRTEGPGEPIPQPEPSPAQHETIPAAAVTPPAAAGEPGSSTQPSPAGTPSAAPRSAAMVTPATDQAAVCTAAVVDVDGVWTSDGRQLPLPEHGITSIADFLDLGHALRLGTVVRKGWTVDGQIWVTHQMAAQLGIDVDAIQEARATQREKVTHDVTRGVPAVQSALEQGVFLGPRDADSLGRWTRLYREGGDGVRLVLMAAMNPQQKEPRLIEGDPTPQQLARRVGLLAEHLGFPFQHGASSTGLDLMMALRPFTERDRLFPVLDPPPPGMMTVEDDIDWCRPPTEEEAGHQWCHAYDRGGSYLGGIAGLKLGIGAPQHHPDGTDFVREMPGYWRIEVPDTPGDWRYPALLDYLGKRRGQTRWVSTPTLQLALEHEHPVKVLEAYTWPESSRILDSWYTRMRNAREQLDVDGDPDATAARNQVKEIYTKAIGMLGSHQYQSGQRTYRPDWRHHIQAKSNANVIRRIITIGNQTGRWPVAVLKDTVVYTSNDPNPESAWPGGTKTYGRRLGNYHPEGSSPLAEQLPFLTGGPYRGRDTLVTKGDSQAGAE